MTGEEILQYILPEIVILIPVLIILGQAIKQIPKVKDWTIPIILAVIGIVVSILILGFENGFTGSIVLNGVLQGILCAGMAVYVHQLTIQSTRKRKEDEDQD
ncbi:phage holin family protein [Sporanaerobacter acetigenes]|uniref:Phage holin family Hol44, holin superfamily V n=1 Tax=Sporanaerobacter acetigenes DSM 13106 TaxID=1123281 RepID=A0A1M5TXW3_9FIRM|nr:phage holin family protein [Sporanaerobacter acetigenes]SHH55617.1 Phage holin family Hol44, holin superfamily V [Sporanaerobacter acetigenes DSM 13106]